MAIAAAIAFKQGVTVGAPGFALIGTTGTPVTVSNGDNTNVEGWTFEVIDAPPASAVPRGVVQDGTLPTYAFTPDASGGYEVHLVVTDQFGNFAEDFRVFQVAEPSGRYIAPFKATDQALNFTIPPASSPNTRGWAPLMEAYLRAFDAGGGGGGGGLMQVDEFVATAAQTSFVLSQVPTQPSAVELHVDGVLYQQAEAWTFSAPKTVVWNNAAFTMSSGQDVDVRYMVSGSPVVGLETIDNFTPTAAQVNFVLSHAPANSSLVWVFVNGVFYEITEAWVFVGPQTVQWNNSEFVMATDDEVLVRYFY